MDYTDYVIRIFISVVLDFLIGLEQQLTRYLAGILSGSNLILRSIARKIYPITSGDKIKIQYRISVTCQESCEVVGDKIEMKKATY